MTRTKSLTIALVVVVAGVLCGLVPAAAQVSAHGGLHHRHEVATHHRRTPNYAWRLFKATNASRFRFGLPRLALNRDASVLAQRHSRAMARSHRLFHSSDPGRYLHGVGRWSNWGENIGWTSASVDDLQKAFMNSSVHRGHILSRSFRHVAVGAVLSGHKIWVTLFFYG
jgi:uncharacterized protein YkwD